MRRVARPPPRLAVLVSGGGSTLRNLVERIEDGRLKATIAVVVASRPGILALDIAARAGVPTHVLPARRGLAAEYSPAMFDLARTASSDLVVLAGFLSLLQIPTDFEGRVINIHPSLLPAFGGQGYYGLRVHQAVLDRGVKVTGCTVHFVDNEFDHGPIIAQRCVGVEEDDTPEAVAARVGAAERELLPEVIQLFGEGRLTLRGRRVRIEPPRP